MIEEVTKPDYHIFRFSRENVKRLFPDQVFRDVISSDAFRRLQSIHFLGSIDYLLAVGNKGVEERHNRYDHSLAVATLASRFLQWHDIARDEYEAIVVSALLHDIGHAPLSHSLEPSFRSLFELDHHLVGERILRGEEKIGQRLSKALERNGINNFKVMALISGVGNGIGKELFSRQINIDTIEGIIRSASYQNRPAVLLNPLEVIDAFARLGKGAEEILDEFWLLKNRVYSSVIQNWKGLIADLLCTRYMERNAGRFRSTYYFGTERELKNDHSSLFSILSEFGLRNVIPADLIADGEDIRFVKRSFYIDASVPIRSFSDLDRRYLQSKKVVTMTVKKRGGDDAHRPQPYPKVEDLF